MDVTKVLTDSWQAVLDSGVPKEMQKTAFNRAVDLFGYAPAVQSPIVAPPAGGTVPTPSAASTPPKASAASTATDGPLTDDILYAKLKEATGVDTSKFENVVHVEEGVPQLSVSSKRLPESKKKAARLLIAKIMLVSRSIGLGEQEVSLSAIRDVCDTYGLKDGNFATDMKELKNLDGLTLTSDGKKFKVRRTFTDKFGDILDELAPVGAS